MNTFGIRTLLISIGILLIPLISMQFTDEVNWDCTDFLVSGLLLVGTGLSYEMVSRGITNNAYKSAVGLSLFAALLLIWVNLAVGIIGGEDHSENWLYADVLVVGLAGAFLVRLKATGMAFVMVATAVAQALVWIIAFIARWGQGGPNWPWPMLGATVIFMILWLTSAYLFKRAAKEG